MNDRELTGPIGSLRLLQSIAIRWTLLDAGTTNLTVEEAQNCFEEKQNLRDLKLYADSLHPMVYGMIGDLTNLTHLTLRKYWVNLDVRDLGTHEMIALSGLRNLEQLDIRNRGGYSASSVNITSKGLVETVRNMTSLKKLMIGESDSDGLSVVGLEATRIIATRLPMLKVLWASKRTAT